MKKYLLLLCCWSFATSAEFFVYYGEYQDIIGKSFDVIAQPGNTLMQLGRKYDIGHVEMIEANPDLHPIEEFAYETRVIIPRQFILPDAKRTGIVINIAEMRLYFYHTNGEGVSSYPIGIGRIGWATPLGSTKIVAKKEQPIWFPTKNIQQDAKKQGIELANAIYPGEDNPLGDYCLRLAWTEYLIHGTNRPEGVGRRSSAGCIRMYPEDIADLFKLVKIGTQVTIVNQPVKFGWYNQRYYLEVHEPLAEDIAQYPDWVDIVEKCHTHINKLSSIDWQTAQEALSYHTGIPVAIATIQRTELVN